MQIFWAMLKKPLIKRGPGLEPRNCIRRYLTRQRLFYRPRSRTPELWWAGQGSRKARRFPYAPVVPTLFSPPPASLEPPVVEVIHCIRRLPSWLQSQLPHSSKLRSSTVRLLFSPCMLPATSSACTRISSTKSSI